MKDFTETQNKAIDAAVKALKNRSWFKGVCLDNVPSDEQCREDFDGAVSSIICETQMWDSPSWPDNS